MAYKDKAVKTAKQNEFIAKAYDRVNLLVPKGKKELIREAAERKGKSVNAFINDAIQYFLDNDLP